jgi:hypothetical protein
MSYTKPAVYDVDAESDNPMIVKGGVMIRKPSIEEQSERRYRLSSEKGEVKDFVASHGLTSSEAQELLQRYGRNELEDKKVPKVKSEQKFIF